MSRGFELASRRLVIAAALLAYLLTWRDDLVAQSPRQIKVLLESQQLVNQNREALQGSGGVVIRRGNAEPRPTAPLNGRPPFALQRILRWSRRRWIGLTVATSSRRQIVIIATGRAASDISRGYRVRELAPRSR
jgi:hypothetical protein